MEKFSEVPYHRSITISTMTGRYTGFTAFLFCQRKGRLPHEFFYYNMLLNFDNNDGSWSLSKGGKSRWRSVQHFFCDTVSSVKPSKISVISDVCVRKEVEPRWSRSEPVVQVHAMGGIGLYDSLRFFCETRWRISGVDVRAQVWPRRDSRYSPKGVGLQYRWPLITVRSRPAVSWRSAGVVQGNAKLYHVLRRKMISAFGFFLESYAAWRKRAYLSVVYSNITLFSRFLASNRSNTVIPTTGSISRPICSHGQLGRGNQRSPYVSGTLHSWLRWVHRCISTYTAERSNSADGSSTPMVWHHPFSPCYYRPKRKRKCRRWQQRSGVYRRSRTKSRNRLRRHRRRLSPGGRSTPLDRGAYHYWWSTIRVATGFLCRWAYNQSKDNLQGTLLKYPSLSGFHRSITGILFESAFRRNGALSQQEFDFQRRRRAERGGGSHDLIPRYITPTEIAPGEDDVLPLDNDEDWYPLYVLQASRLTDVDLSRPYTHDVLPRESFQDMPLTAWLQVFSSMGVPFTTKLSSIKHLLPKGSVVSCGYPARQAPNPDISAMSLEDALTHTRVVYHRLARLQKTKAKIKRKLGQIYGRRCKKSPRVRQIAIDELTAELYRVRTAIQQYDDLHKRLCRKTKSRVRETSKILPATIRVPLASFTIPTSNQFTLLDEDNSDKRVVWSDLMVMPSPLVMGEVDKPSLPPVSLLQPSPTDSPLETLMNLRRDMASLAPAFEGQAPTLAYGVVGSYKDLTVGASCTLTIMTLNANGLTSHKLPYLCSLLQQDRVDVLICVDTRHSEDQVRSFNKQFRERLGAGTVTYFTKDALRKPTEPGGIGIIVGTKWGPSLVRDGSRTDHTGHGVLARIRLRTSSGFLSIYGTYWPFVPSKEDLEKGESKLWYRVREFCINKRIHDSDPIRHIQSLYDQWASRDWEDCTTLRVFWLKTKSMGGKVS